MNYRILRILTRLSFLIMIGFIWYLPIYLITTKSNMLDWGIVYKLLYIGLMMISFKTINESVKAPIE